MMLLSTNYDFNVELNENHWFEEEKNDESIRIVFYFVKSYQKIKFNTKILN